MKFKRFVLCFIIISLICFLFFHWQNNAIVVNNIIFKNNEIPKSFNNFRILQISDLHNKEFGKNQKYLLKEIENLNPDIIVITGDIIDSNHYDLNITMKLIQQIPKTIPIYYVSGNHEYLVNKYDEIKETLKTEGVIVLDNEQINIEKDNEFMTILGLMDSSFLETDNINNILYKLTKDNKDFTILLSHRPELFDIYTKFDIDLIFSGHAHGGQFRIPIIGPIFAPNQGFFPKLTEGIHTNNDTSMIISRGLGNSVIPIRLLNRPELIVVTLSSN